MKYFWTGITFIIYCTQASYALSLTRGPYIQKLSHDSVTIVWETDVSATSKVKYKKDSDWTNKKEYDLVTHHAISLSGLTDDQDYTYKVHSDDVVLSSAEQFHTAPRSSTTRKIKFAVLGDSGVGSTDQSQVSDQLVEWEPEFVVHVGDVVYPAGANEDYDNNFFTPYQAWLKQLAFFPSIGNHDYVTVADYLQVFHLPKSDSNTENYYSFNYGYAHFIALNTNEDFAANSPQQNWLVEDLSNNNKTWTIVFFHHSPFSSSSHGENQDVQDFLIPLFERYEVDVVFTGHDHTYERIKRMNIYGENNHKVLYIVTGGGGASLYPLVVENDYTKVFLSEHHFVGVSLQPESLKIKMISKDGMKLDSYTIEK